MTPVPNALLAGALGGTWTFGAGEPLATAWLGHLTASVQAALRAAVAFTAAGVVAGSTARAVAP